MGQGQDAGLGQVSGSYPQGALKGFSCVSNTLPLPINQTGFLTFTLTHNTIVNKRLLQYLRNELFKLLG